MHNILLILDFVLKEMVITKDVHKAIQVPAQLTYRPYALYTEKFTILLRWGITRA